MNYKKFNKPFCIFVVALIITLIPNQTNLLVSSQEATDSDFLEFLGEPRSETQAAIDVFNTKDSLAGLAVLTVRDYTRGPGNVFTHLLLVNNQGKILRELYSKGGVGFVDPQMFNETTLMVQKTTAGFLTFWNLETNKQYTIKAINGTQVGHHDVWYNPVTDTFLTLIHKGAKVEGVTWLADMIVEFNWKGELLWEWNMHDWVTNYFDTQCTVSDHSRDYSTVTQFGEINVVLPVGTRDYSHTNTVFWDSNTNIIYINPRNLDNVWAIEYPTGKVLWRAGRNGNFTMYDKHGVQKDSLWWHSHAFYPVPNEPNKFILFDNDLHNGTAEPNIPAEFEGGNYHTSTISRIVEVEIDTDTLIMRETWSWEALPKYYSPVWGYAARLPNGNRIGCFGSAPFREGKFWDSYPPYAKEGGTLIEVNDTDIVWQLSFPSGWGMYRARRFQPSLSLNSPEDLICDRGENDCQAIIWTGKSLFKDYYQITKDGALLANNTWTTDKIYYDLPSNLEVGTHEFTLTVFDLAGQSVSNTVKIKVRNPIATFTPVPSTTTTVAQPILYHGGDSGLVPVFEFLVVPMLAGGLATVGLMLLFKRKKV